MINQTEILINILLNHMYNILLCEKQGNPSHCVHHIKLAFHTPVHGHQMYLLATQVCRLSPPPTHTHTHRYTHTRSPRTLTYKNIHDFFFFLLSLIPISPTSQITKKLHSLFNAIIKGHDRPVAHVPLRSIAQIKVMCTSQSHFHRCQSWVERDQGADEFADNHEEKSDEVDEKVREVNVRRVIAQSLNYASHEGPEVDGLVIGDVVGLDMKKKKITKVMCSFF